MKTTAKKVDPKRINVPNICFSLIAHGDKRERDFAKQRLERGFDDSETWSLDITIAKFILPRLKRFKEVAHTYPASMTRKQWGGKLDKMIEAMELVIKNTSGSDVMTKRELKKMQDGLNLFASHFLYLWW